jgi:hypothetical protein
MHSTPKTATKKKRTVREPSISPRVQCGAAQRLINYAAFYRRTQIKLPDDSKGRVGLMLTFDQDAYCGHSNYPKERGERKYCGHSNDPKELDVRDVFETYKDNADKCASNLRLRLEKFRDELEPGVVHVHIRIDLHAHDYMGIRVPTEIFDIEAALFHPPCTEVCYLGNAQKSPVRRGAFHIDLEKREYYHTREQYEQNKNTLLGLVPVRVVDEMIRDPACPLRNGIVENPDGLMFDGLTWDGGNDTPLKDSENATRYEPYECGPRDELTDDDIYTKTTYVLNVGPQDVVNAWPLDVHHERNTIADCTNTHTTVEEIPNFMKFTREKGGDVHARNTTNPAQTTMLMRGLILRAEMTQWYASKLLTPQIMPRDDYLSKYTNFTRANVNTCGLTCRFEVLPKSRRGRVQYIGPSGPCQLPSGHLGAGVHCDPGARFVEGQHWDFTFSDTANAVKPKRHCRRCRR